MSRYVYDGAVTEFGRCVSAQYTASTTAESEKKARSNIAYRWKKEHGKAPISRVELPDKIHLVE